MKTALHIVDSIEYVKENCFQHQLLETFRRSKTHQVQTVPLNALSSAVGEHDCIVSSLKLRTLDRNIVYLKNCLGDAPLTIYEQDPWEAFREGSPFQGAYERITASLNVKSFSVTTRWWSKFIVSQGLPSTFVKMWVLPEYCYEGRAFVGRTVDLGFVGSLHSYRASLFDSLKTGYGIDVSLKRGGLGYESYLVSLRDHKVFIHAEDLEIRLRAGEMTNLNKGLWIKDIEAASQGCFSIRNRGEDSESYIENVPTVALYDDVREVPDILRSINSMDPEERQQMIISAVNFIKNADFWSETTSQLLV